MLPDALHAVRSLISCATGETPHERLFRHHRKSAAGTAVPSWMSVPGPVLMRRHVRQSKYEPLVEEVELIHANPHYAFVKMDSGREATVSTHDLAPAGKTVDFELEPDEPGNDNIQSEVDAHIQSEVDGYIQSEVDADSRGSMEPAEQVVLRRSERTRRAPPRLDL